jgi:hypothetical protein
MQPIAEEEKKSVWICEDDHCWRDTTAKQFSRVKEHKYFFFLFFLTTGDVRDRSSRDGLCSDQQRLPAGWRRAKTGLVKYLIDSSRTTILFLFCFFVEQKKKRKKKRTTIQVGLTCNVEFHVTESVEVALSQEWSWFLSFATFISSNTFFSSRTFILHITRFLRDSRVIIVLRDFWYRVIL